MNATLLSEVLLGIATKSRFSQGLYIEFKSKGGYKCSTHIWLDPQYYHGGFHQDEIEFSGYKHNFGVLFQIEKESSFSKWTKIMFRNSDENKVGMHDNYTIVLDCDVWFEEKRSHYSGRISKSWMDFVDKGHRIHTELLEEIKKEKKSRTSWQRFKKWIKEDVIETLAIAFSFGGL